MTGTAVVVPVPVLVPVSVPETVPVPVLDDNHSENVLRSEK